MKYIMLNENTDYESIFHNDCSDKFSYCQFIGTDR